MEGARRPYRVVPDDLQVEPAGAEAIAVRFALPRGSYALSVLREITKSGAPEPDPEV
jgi:tRNA pseudouridine13 synthase